MPTANDVLVHSLTFSQKMLHRYTTDLAPAEYLHRPTAKANCAAWIIGHLTLTDRGALKMYGVSDVPALPEGFEKRFSRDEGCPQANEFGDVSSLVSLFDDHRARLIEAVKRATPQQLDKPLEKPHPLFGTVGEFANFVQEDCPAVCGLQLP